MIKYIISSLLFLLINSCNFVNYTKFEKSDSPKHETPQKEKIKTIIDDNNCVVRGKV